MAGKSRKQEKSNQKKAERLIKFAGLDLCACCSGHQKKCEGVCREVHTNPKTGHTECGELYQVDCKDLNCKGSKRPKRGWKFGKQKESAEHKDAKQSRKKKMDRDKSE